MVNRYADNILVMKGREAPIRNYSLYTVHYSLTKDFRG